MWVVLTDTRPPRIHTVSITEKEGPSSTPSRHKVTGVALTETLSEMKVRTSLVSETLGGETVFTSDARSSIFHSTNENFFVVRPGTRREFLVIVNKFSPYYYYTSFVYNPRIIIIETRFIKCA